MLNTLWYQDICTSCVGGNVTLGDTVFYPKTITDRSLTVIMQKATMSQNSDNIK